jgi:deoxyribodipyrimidine photolyase-related protein
MSNIILYPHNLFELKYYPSNFLNLLKAKTSNVYLVEDPLYFGDKTRIQKFSKHKLVLHRSSMKHYFDYLIASDIKVKYIDYKDTRKFYEDTIKNTDCHIFDLADNLLETRLKKISKTLEIYYSPLFLLSRDDINEYASEKTGSHKYLHKVFYLWQINKMNISEISKSYDDLNRNKLPKNIETPDIDYVKLANEEGTRYIEEGKEYINKFFPSNYGDLDLYMVPITHKGAKKWLTLFLTKKFYNFGNYQDAVNKEEDYLFHSLLAPMLNIGLITPKYVIDETRKYYKNHKKDITINNYEGFIRQIIGWREYERMLYHLEYDKLVSSNHFNLGNKLDNRWYDGSTGIKPLDDMIKKAFKTGYLHHIERLMIVLNLMILFRIRPLDAYRWFMEFSSDSYDWVMIGNIYGMGYYSTITTTKPYISTSNYIFKMSNYKKGDGWDKVWDALFYQFLVDNEKKMVGSASTYLRNLAYYKKLSKKEQLEIKNRVSSVIRI